MVDIFKIKDIIDEDFVNYKKPSMFIATNTCSFKCELEDINVKCQNMPIVKQPTIVINIDNLIKRYLSNDITKAIVIGGLEPFDQFEELCSFIKMFRNISNDDVVIYTGYNKDEIIDKVNILLQYNIKGIIIIKYGRFINNGKKRYDDVLGIELASSNQYAVAYNN